MSAAWVRRIVTLFAVLWIADAVPQAARTGSTTDRSIEIGGVARTYRLHVPGGESQRPLPLVLVFHGGGGDGRGIERLTRFNAIADREGFLVAYPNGLERNWNDGREPTVSAAHRDNVDDLGFVIAMIDAISRAHAVDARRIYAAGMSNGAIFAHYLAAHHADRIAAIAPVVGGIAEPFAPRFNPSRPVAVMIIQGTEDPLTPYAGGGILRGKRGRIVPTEEGARMWARRNGCASEETHRELAELDATDGCRVERWTWSACREGAEVQLLRLVGAGHTWPGGTQYLPERLVGKVCRELDATETIWKFFAAHERTR